MADPLPKDPIVPNMSSRQPFMGEGFGVRVKLVFQQRLIGRPYILDDLCGDRHRMIMKLLPCKREPNSMRRNRGVLQ